MGFWSSLFQLGAAAVGALTFGWLAYRVAIGWLLGSLIGSFFNRPERHETATIDRDIRTFRVVW
jgi:hypothetical protein